MSKLRLVVDNDLSPREVAALRLASEVAKTRRAAVGLRGPGRADLDADIEQLRAVSLRVSLQLANWRTK